MTNWKKLVGMGLVAAMVFSATADRALAKYVDRSDELPGMESDSDVVGEVVIGALVIAAVATGVYFLYRLVKKNRNKGIAAADGPESLPLVYEGKRGTVRPVIEIASAPNAEKGHTVIAGLRGVF